MPEADADLRYACSSGCAGEVHQGADPWVVIIDASRRTRDQDGLQRGRIRQGFALDDGHGFKIHGRIGCTNKCTKHARIIHERCPDRLRNEAGFNDGQLHGAGGASGSCPATQALICASSTSSGTAPSSSTASWNALISNCSPSAALASARNARIFNSPIL